MMIRILALLLAVLAGSPAWAGAAEELYRRTNGVWASNAEGCRLYVSGVLDHADVDMSTRRKFEVAKIWQGVFEFEYAKARMKMNNVRQMGAGTFVFDAAFVLRGMDVRDQGMVQLVGNRAEFTFKNQRAFMDMTLVRCK